MTDRRADWHRTYREEPKFIPRSQDDGVRWAVTIQAPIQAYIALCSGSLSGDLDALKRCMSDREILICEECQQRLYANGNGHDQENCMLFKQALAVLTDETGQIERQKLVHERRLQERQEKKKARFAERRW